MARKMMNQTNTEIGKLIWERQLFESAVNCEAVKRIQALIDKIRDSAKRKETKDGRHND